MKRLNLFGAGIQSVSSAITSQRRVNVYYDLRPDGEKSQLVICSTPGLSLLFSLPTQPIRGMIQVGNYAFVVGGNQLYLLSPIGGYVSLGSFGQVGVSNQVGMAFNETQLLIVDGQYGYVINYAALLAFFESEQFSLLGNLALLNTIVNAVT